jgi:hypothetical protein
MPPSKERISMADRPWTNDATLTVALWIAENARDWVVQTSQEIIVPEDLTGFATEIEEALTEKHLQISYYLPFIEADDASIAHLDLSTVDYLQIATRIVEDLDNGGN